MSGRADDSSEVPGGSHPASVPPTVSANATREPWIDLLRVVVIAGVIVVHAAITYVVPIDWYYEERTSSAVWLTLLAFPTLIGGAFALGPLFWVAGWLSAGSLARKGSAPFLRGRLLRLGVPLLAFVLIVDPLSDFIGDVGEGEASPLTAYLHPDSTGPMWFVAALLGFTLVYAALGRARPRAARGQAPRPALLVAAAGAIAVGSLAAWQLWPLTERTFLDLSFGAWPQGAVLFALGAHAAETGWMNGLPATLVRRLAWIAMAGLAACVTLLSAQLALIGPDVQVSGLGWPTVAFALLDGAIAVSGTLSLVAWLSARRLTEGALLARAGSASYPAYVIHPLVLTTISALLAAVALAPELKFLIVAPVAVPTCFGIGHALTRIPGLSEDL